MVDATDLFDLYYSLTKQFSESMEQPVNVNFSRPLLELRMRLIEEELAELRDEFIALDKELKEDRHAVNHETLTRFLKELCDLEYVTAGYCATFGLPHVPHKMSMFVAVDDNKLTSTSNALSKLSMDDRWELFNNVESSVQDISRFNSRIINIFTYSVSGNDESPLYLVLRLATSLSELSWAINRLAESMELPFMEAFIRVHKSNMSKLGEDGKPVYREDGKVKKGPNYRKPDLSDLINSRLDVK